jgi:membrane-associated phospholipid phosphatase
LGSRLLRFVALWWENSYALVPIGFTGIMCLYFIYLGDLLYSVPTLLFLLGVPTMCVASAYRRTVRGWLVLVTIVFSYEALAGPIDSLADSGRILSLFDVDKYLWGFNLTGWIQSTFASNPLTDATLVLYEMLIPFMFVTSIALWKYGRPQFRKYITAMLLTSYAAMVTFLLVPTAPPWLLGEANNLLQSSGFGSSMARLGPLANLFEPDYYAAFPSLHAAYLVICSYFLLKVDRRPGAFSILFTGGVLFSTLYLGQHYLIDLLAGVVYAMIPCLISEKWQLL